MDRDLLRSMCCDVECKSAMAKFMPMASAVCSAAEIPHRWRIFLLILMNLSYLKNRERMRSWNGAAQHKFYLFEQNTEYMLCKRVEMSAL
jgi:hypothetical protein